MSNSIDNKANDKDKNTFGTSTAPKQPWQSGGSTNPGSQKPGQGGQKTPGNPSSK
jgi:hypothetical protein